MDKIITRRKMIKGSCAIIGAAGFNTLPLFAFNNTMINRAIPSSKEKIPVIGLGSWQQFDVGEANAERNPLKEVLLKMNEMGGKMIDASPMYGRAEQVIGDLSTELALNNKFFLATKVWTTGKQEGIEQMTASLQKMKRTSLDLMQVHNLQNWQTHLKTLQGWKESGKVRYIGVTHYTDSAHDRLESIVKSKVVDFVQFNYSIRSRNAEKSLLKAARDNGVAVIINEPFEQGELFRFVKGKSLPAWSEDYGIKSWAQFFLKYIISDPGVTCVIPGTSDVKHITDNLGAGFGQLPDVQGRKKMLEWITTI
ncbi:aldo/keto reductase [Dyadobacter sp. CY312]|uniref:aldo/keto reductase n=1 Tax=Dyadobacter sp. CY312 TaxID=2907303 RepID=UPI001F48A6FC|nr:aldo/keto reductase [Dyadobacter sp. CY312]MCE7038815.1 aldo/keto reductase [Dyadobacter sp. CY312]